MNKLKSFLIEEIQEKLEMYKGTTVYSCDLAYKLFEAENCDGSFTYSTYKAKEWIKEYWEDIGEVVEEIKFQLGAEFIPNVFEEPEKFQVVIILEGASYLLSKCQTIYNNWDDQIELDNEIIEKLKSELEELNNSYDFYN